jgi:DNA-binding GntR family transcriptional regulator
MNVILDQASSPASLVQVLEDDILSGRLLPGARLDEQALAKRFEVSRTPVREALRHLASSGLVEIKRNQGATVMELTTRSVVEMFQVLAEMEGLAARLCARRMTRADIEALRTENDICRVKADQDDQTGFILANNAFHDVIWRCSQNHFLYQEASKLGKRLNPYRRYVTHPRRMQESCDDHSRLLQAIENGDGERADRLMREHVELIAGGAADVVVALESSVLSHTD